MSGYQPDEGRYVGRQVRAIRARRGITQQVLADRVGISRGALAKYENGERPVDSRRKLLALASALGVTVGDLTGHEQEKLDPATAEFHMVVPEIETVLWSRGNVTDTRPMRTLDELLALTELATKIRNDCDYARLGPMLVPLLTDAYRHVYEADTAHAERAWDVFGTVAYGIASALRARGYHALAWTAAQEVERAARNVGGPAPIAAAAFSQGQIMLSRPGALPAALATTMGTAERIAADVRTVGEIETYGMLHLQASIVAATMGGDPEPHLMEAVEQANRLDRAPAPTSVARNASFGAANVGVWRMSAAMERGEPGQVLALAPQLRLDEIPNEGRRAQYFVEIGRAYAFQRKYRESLHALLRAEHAAPQHVRSMVHVRELVGHMMRSARRDLTSGDLGKLAQRVGVVPA
ncbi:helix-turn-helix domain-containing protein [Nocardia brasiliensis]|uniref:helix-turn-helix domain-containing protein n=1 Tax=Nocardia brasiliensis TaxID=37326 RepID=UPI001894DC2F|nr:helix-turn-helix transcriptional regulator [Nocardia brasiliensis]MBF6131145.1 helix-turn-helix transcriptional regulator [Nocardia brasiliensis]